ncbi:MAG: hypothetical protein HFE63_03710 [Clostridiales bacterium]|nr:hypothetical protein [Clostridiales bacterium]
MKEYIVKILPTSDIDWSQLDTANIDSYVWDKTNALKAGAQLAYVKSGDEHEGLYTHLWCEESNPPAVYKNHNEAVYTDSCLEVFFTMNEKNAPTNGYINIEANSAPATLIAYGTGRGDRTSIVDLGIKPFDVSCKKTDDRWELFEFIPLSVLQQIFHIDEVTADTEMRGNFYKCAETVNEHYGSWSPINTPEPDFHRPECFGKLILK